MTFRERFEAAFPGFILPTDSLVLPDSEACAWAVVGDDAVDAARALAEALQSSKVRYESVSSVKAVVDMLESVTTDVVLVIGNFEDVKLRKKDSALFEDAIQFHLTKWRGLGLHVMLLFSLSRELSWCKSFDRVICLPRLPNDRLGLLVSLLPQQLPIHLDCGRSGILDALTACSQFWSRSDLIVLVKQSCLFAVASDSGLTCEHVSTAHRLLFKPDSASSPVGFCSPSAIHRCSIVPTVTLDDFKGSPEAVSAVSAIASTALRLVAISGCPGSGKSMLARLLVSRAAPDISVSYLKAADVLRAVVGESEKNLAKLLTDVRAIIFEDADQLFPADLTETTGAVQRLLPTFLHAIDHLVNQTSCLVVLTTRDAALLHPRIVSRLACSVGLDSTIDRNSRETLFSKWLGYSSGLVGAAVEASEGMTGSGCARLMREAGVKAITRYISKRDSSEAAITCDDFK